jgi:hypothetical protein
MEKHRLFHDILSLLQELIHEVISNYCIIVMPKIHAFYNEPNIVTVIKSSRLRWAGHVVRMDDNELPKKIL